ncbi:lytic transglycosylase domain-containing protein [Streptomyces sp. KLOTTS4A1]|uniref:lytic transglycosylase domain-containing protein n=1 Tax=Streptomyces sp. KLOTTS4A1 TaxID=3390996 RepID=UPI0039F4FED1
MGYHNRHRRPERCRLGRGVAGSALVAMMLAGLTASHMPGGASAAPAPPGETGGGTGEGDWIPPGGPSADVYHTELPPLRVQPVADTGGDGRAKDTGGTRTDSASGIPASALAAYRSAESALRASAPGCRLPWQLLAAIGKVESGHARGGRVDRGGTTLRPILGPVLNGDGFARITDTDAGVYDGDAHFDRAVGPMQFIPSTWARWGSDGNEDGRADPNNVHDAALAAGRYLCAGDRDLAVRADLDRAILSYNHSTAYLRTVLSWLDFYRDGVSEVPDGKGALPLSPGPGGETPANGPVGDGGGIVVGGPPSEPAETGSAVPSPSPPASPSASPSGSPSPTPGEPSPGNPGATPTGPTAGPDPDPSSPGPSPSPDPTGPGPSPTPSPEPTEPGPGTSSPAPSPSAPAPSPTEPSPTEPSPTAPSPTAPSATDPAPSPGEPSPTTPAQQAD